MWPGHSTFEGSVNICLMSIKQVKKKKKKEKGLSGRCCVSGIEISKVEQQSGCETNTVLSSCTTVRSE